MKKDFQQKETKTTKGNSSQGNNSSDKHSSDSPTVVWGRTKEMRKRKNSTEEAGAEGAKEVRSKLKDAKEAWKKLPEAEQESWLEQVASGAKPDEIGERVVKELHIEPYYPYEPLAFLRWLRWQKLARLEAQMFEVTKQELLEGDPELTLDEVREKLLKLAYRWSVEGQDFKTGMQTIGAHCRTERTQLNERQYEDLKRSDEVKALSICMEEAKGYPEVQALFREAFAALKKAKAAR